MHQKTLSPVHALPQPRCKVLGKGVCILKQDSWKTKLVPLSHTHAYTCTTLHRASARPRMPWPAQLAATWDSGVEPSSPVVWSTPRLLVVCWWRTCYLHLFGAGG